MKKIIVGLVALFSISAFAGDGAFYYNGKRLKDNTVQALIFFNEMKAAESSYEKVNICYAGDWTIARNQFTKLLSFFIYNEDVTEGLNVRICNFENKTFAYGTIPACKAD